MMEGKLEISGVKKSHATLLAAFPALLAFGTACFADTFTRRQAGEVLHGYIAGQAENGKAIADAKEKGRVGQRQTGGVFIIKNQRFYLQRFFGASK